MTGAPHSRSARRRARALVLAAALSATSGLGLASATSAAAAPELAPGEMASSGMELVTNLPKNGAFAPEGAFNSDLAFQDGHAFAGNYEGFTVYDLADPRAPRELAQVVCPGSQNDVSVFGDLLVLSVDSRRSDDSCSSRALTTGRNTNTDTSKPPFVSAEEAAANARANEDDRALLQAGKYWEGIRIFDISEPAKPRYVKAVETDCGSHTHTLVPDGDDLFIYVSSYDVNADAKRCNSGADSGTAHDKISVVRVKDGDVSGARKAKVVATPQLFTPGNSGGVVPGFEGVTNDRGSAITYSATRGCHDITAYPERGIAAGACMGEGVLMDITKPTKPKIISTAFDKENFAFWHSATFNDAASTVVFTDELGGGGGATCNPPSARFPQITDERGANAYYSIGADAKMTKQAYFKIPREQALTENCVAHNGSLVPVQGEDGLRDVMVQAWYQGGISVVDFTDPAAPTELAWFDRGALDANRLILGGSWSAYYYEGFVYSNDIQKGLDVFELTAPELASASSVEFPSDYNPQSQTGFTEVDDDDDDKKGKGKGKGKGKDD